MEQQFLNEILKTTFTVDTFKKRYQVLKIKLQKQIYGSGIERRQPAEKPKTGETPAGAKEESINQPSAEEKDWLPKFGEGLTANLTSDQFSSITKHIDTFLVSLKSLSIYFVFVPSEEQLKEIGSYLRKSLNNPGLIFQVKIDPTLIGGCAIVYNGVYKDLSLRARIYEKRDVLVEAFKTYFTE